MADFAWTVSSETRKKAKPRVLEAKFGDGYSQRAPDGLNSIEQTWTVVVKDTAAVVDAVEAFLEGKAGATAFSWRPALAAADVQVICPEWDRGSRNPQDSDLTATFQRVFEP